MVGEFLMGFSAMIGCYGYVVEIPLLIYSLITIKKVTKDNTNKRVCFSKIFHVFYISKVFASLIKSFTFAC